MNYPEKCAWIAARAKPEPTTAQEVDAEIQEALRHPIIWFFLTADDLANATIRTIKMGEQKTV